MLKTTLVNVNALYGVLLIDFEALSTRANCLIMMIFTKLTASAVIVCTKVLMLTSLAIASEEKVFGAWTTVTSFLINALVTALVNSRLALIDIKASRFLLWKLKAIKALADETTIWKGEGIEREREWEMRCMSYAAVHKPSFDILANLFAWGIMLAFIDVSTISISIRFPAFRTRAFIAAK
jgi:hypothetical protein